MTKEEKDLLLKDLCARLPYNTQCEGAYEEEVWHNGFPCSKKVAGCIEGIDHIGFDDDEIYVTVEGIQCELYDVKLYLRPMSSMTEEEKAFIFNGHIEFWIREDYCNKHHLDYRGLIEKGLVLPAPDGMYKI